MYILHQSRPVGDDMTRLDIHRKLPTVFDDNGLRATDSLAIAGNLSLGNQSIKVANPIGGRASGSIVFNNSLLNLS